MRSDSDETVGEKVPRSVAASGSTRRSFSPAMVPGRALVLLLPISNRESWPAFSKLRAMPRPTTSTPGTSCGCAQRRHVRHGPICCPRQVEIGQCLRCHQHLAGRRDKDADRRVSTGRVRATAACHRLDAEQAERSSADSSAFEHRDTGLPAAQIDEHFCGNVAPGGRPHTWRRAPPKVAAARS